MDTQALVAFGIIFGLSGLTYWVWLNVLVPVKRAEVAQSKRAGEIRGYLDELREDGIQPASATGRGFERWLFTDWLEPNKKKDPAVPFLPKSKFNSGDNPVIASTALSSPKPWTMNVRRNITSITASSASAKSLAMPNAKRTSPSGLPLITEATFAHANSNSGAMSR